MIGGCNTRKTMTDKTFCVLPWLHLATHPHGKVTLCCNADHTHMVSASRNRTEHSNDDKRLTSGDRFLSLQTDSVHDIMNSDSFKQVRKEMLADRMPYACMRCYREEAQGIASKRVTENANYPHLTKQRAAEMVDADGTIANVELEFVELRLGNICNVKCRSCNPWSSSKWIADHNKMREDHPELSEFIKTHNDFEWPERQEFWDDLFERTKNARVFYINGGEPTLIKHHFDFLQRLIDAGRSNVRLWYNINMTTMNQEIIDLWRKFETVQVCFSIDDFGDRNEYLRNPTKWTDVERNVDMLLEHRDKLDLSITQTIGFQNYYYLDDFYRWAQSKGLTVHYNFINDPEYYSPLALPKEVRKSTHLRLARTLPQDKMHLLISQFESPDSDFALLNRAMSYTRTLDRLRNENFAQTFPELHKELAQYVSN